MQIALQKQKIATQVVPTQKEQKIVQPTPGVKEFFIPSTILRWIKARATKANPKFGEKEWTISFTGNKENPTSSFSDSESTNKTPIFPLRMWLG